MNKILSLFDPNKIDMTIQMIDAAIFLFFAVSVLYVFIFAFKALGKSKFYYPPADKKYRFAVMFPAYREDSVIIDSVEKFLEQDYPRDKYEIIVIADKMTQETIETLRDLGSIVVEVDHPRSSKTLALQNAIKYIDYNKMKFDVVLILDADNVVKNEYLERLNDAFYSGCSAVQTHRVAKNLNTSMAILDAVSEEMNNSIFRKGHTRFGFSAGLIGSGMAFEYDIFKESINQAKTIGVDKQLELVLLKHNIFVEYLDTVYTYDEKVKNSSQFYNQRRRWISNQIYNLLFGMKELPKALMLGNWDFANKVFQWMLPPRLILLGLLTIIATGLSLFQPNLSIKWWGLLGLLLFTFALALPDYLINGKLIKATLKLPLLFILMVINLFRIPNTRHRFIHTSHSEKNNPLQNN